VRGSALTDPMVLALKGKELVNGVDGGGVSRVNPELSSAGKSIGGIGDPGPPLRHDNGARHLAIVYKARQSEVSLLEGPSNRLHVASNLGGSSEVAFVPFERDAASIGEWLEAMS
jgi:hypothetical protein